MKYKVAVAAPAHLGFSSVLYRSFRSDFRSLAEIELECPFYNWQTETPYQCYSDCTQLYMQFDEMSA